MSQSRLKFYEQILIDYSSYLKICSSYRILALKDAATLLA